MFARALKYPTYFSALFIFPDGRLKLSHVPSVARMGTKFLQPQAQFLQVKVGPPEPGVQEVQAQCLQATCSACKSTLRSSGQNVTEFMDLKMKGVEKKNYIQLTRE